MCVVMWLSLPVAILCIVVLYAIVMNWSQGVPFCDTWLRPILPSCN